MAAITNNSEKPKKKKKWGASATADTPGLLRMQHHDGHFVFACLDGVCGKVTVKRAKEKWATLEDFRTLKHGGDIFATLVARAVLQRVETINNASLDANEVRWTIADSFAQNRFLYRGAHENFEERMEGFLTTHAHPSSWNDAAVQLVEDCYNMTPKTCTDCGAEYLPARARCPECLTTVELKSGNHDADPYDFEFDFSSPSADIFNVKWDTVKGVHWSHGGAGSLGVLLVQVEGGAVVFKAAGTHLAGELLLSRLLPMLNIRTPAMRHVRADSPEAQLAIAAFGRAPHSTAEVAMSIVKLFTFPVYSVMEFVQGTSVENLQDKASQFLCLHDVMYEMGKISLCDVLVNNFDRVPLAWENDGNPGNLLIHPGLEGKVEVIAVDQQVNVIAMEHISAYQQKAMDVVQGVASGTPGEALNRVLHHVDIFTGHTVDDAGLESYCQGVFDCRESLRALLDCSPDLFADLAREVAESMADIQGYPVGVKELQSKVPAFMYAMWASIQHPRSVTNPPV